MVSVCHAIGPKRQMPGGWGQSPQGSQRYVEGVRRWRWFRREVASASPGRSQPLEGCAPFLHPASLVLEGQVFRSNATAYVLLIFVLTTWHGGCTIVLQEIRNPNSEIRKEPSAAFGCDPNQFSRQACPRPDRGTRRAPERQNSHVATLRDLGVLA